MHKKTTSPEVTLGQLAIALLNDEGAFVGQCVMDLHESVTDFEHVGKPPAVTSEQLVVAAAVIELLALRRGNQMPAWTQSIGALPQPRFLMGGYERRYPALAERWMRNAPAPLRTRNLFAPAEFLEFA